VLVFSYIAFDVLDLDLSDFPLKQVPYKRVVFLIEMPKGTQLSNMQEPDGLRMKPSVLDPSIFKESIRLQHKEKLRVLHFRMNCIHVLRLSLPRLLPWTRLALPEALFRSVIRRPENSGRNSNKRRLVFSHNVATGEDGEETEDSDNTERGSRL
jgi:hypothetical protein